MFDRRKNVFRAVATKTWRYHFFKHENFTCAENEWDNFSETLF